MSKADRRQILVTSALPYANGSIHLGHLLEYIQTDIWVRFQKLRGHQCIYVCADDAHGTAIMLRAEKLGITAEELIDNVQKEHQSDFANFLIEFDCYHSTHSEENRALSTSIYEQNRDKGYIVEREITQLYDEEKALFLADRFVKGECPHCGAVDQYGDNCEVCSSTYAATELKNPISVYSGSQPVERQSAQLFFDLPQFEPQLKAWIQSNQLQPEIANKLLEWFKDGLQQWDISREAPYFGFEIPDRPGKYFYVWLDAPIGYMASFAKYCHEQGITDFDTFWQANATTELHHFIGKDIINFHGLFWPAMLMGAGFRLPTAIHAHGFLMINGQKMSKSRGTFIKASTYLEHCGPEYLRYYFASKLTSRVDDLDLNLDDFVQKVNADLVNKLVNIASRVAKFISKQFSGQLASEFDQPELITAALDASETIADHFEARDFSKAVKHIMSLADQANAYIDDVKPWVLSKSDQTLEQERVQKIATTSLELFRILMIYLKPILPELSSKAEAFLNRPDQDWAALQSPLLGETINPFKPLLQRIDHSQVEGMVAAATEA